MWLLSFMETRWDFRFSNDTEKAALLFLPAPTNQAFLIRQAGVVN